MAGEIELLQARNLDFVVGHDAAGLVGRQKVGATVWTPDLQFGGAKVGVTYSTQVGRYRQIGNIVEVRGRIVLTSKGSSTGLVTIAGLPVPIGASILASGFIPRYSGFAGLTGALHMFGSSGASALQLFQSGATAGAAVTDAALTDTTDLAFWASYQVD